MRINEIITSGKDKMKVDEFLQFRENHLFFLFSNVKSIMNEVMVYLYSQVRFLGEN